MADDTQQSHPHGMQLSNARGHPMPRRATPEKSVTLLHHRLAREASKRATPATESAADNNITISARRNSSDESHETDVGAKKWFDRSNRNPAGNYEGVDMDIDPPFFQKETTDSSNEEQRQNEAFSYGQEGLQVPALRPTETRSSSADDFRSVIDDLTIENKRLKEELKRYKQFGPPMMRKEKLFEIKVHGLPKRKKRELEATLRDFAASLEGSSESHSQRRKQDRQGKNLYSSGESRSKHASSSSSHSRRPVDSAYASMSTGPSSHAPNSIVANSMSRPPAFSRAKSSMDQKLESFPVDTPDGLFPRRVMMTDKDRKKLVVRRLEQLFTGKISGRNMHRNQSMSSLEVPAAVESSVMGPPQQPEASREAVIQPLDASQRKPRSRDNSSTENGDQAESGGNGAGSGDGNGSGGRGGSNTSPPTASSLPEQRPTRPRDLDPDRTQIPSENLDYIRHLGLVPAEFLMDSKASDVNVSPDADGWVYLNLLCNLAQLHIFNVTPGFIRTAVSEKSAKFQLSPDGQKIRWRGGTDGTKFSSDSSGDNSQRSPSTDDGSNHRGQRKRVKTSSQGTVTTESKFVPQASSHSEPFHYKPLFVHRTSSADTSIEGSGSLASDEVLDDSNPDNSRGYSGSGSSQQKRRRIDGAIIYYSGAPFCTDLSGDPGDTSPTTYLTSTARDLSSLDPAPRLEMHRSLSGSSLVIRPLSDARETVSEALGMNLDNPPSPDLSSDAEVASEDDDVQFPWSDGGDKAEQRSVVPPLDSCGLGGVIPEDHFSVVVTTRRPITRSSDRGSKRGTRVQSEDNAEAIAIRLAFMRTSSPLAPRGITSLDGPVKIRYLGGEFRRFNPSPLPPPAMFIPPFSSDSESCTNMDDECSEEHENLPATSISESVMSRRANPHLSVNTAPEQGDFPFAEDSGMEVDMNVDRISDGDDDIDSALRPSHPGGIVNTGSSVATAGGAESGYSSSLEDDAS
ncbi:putative frequency clock protein [Podospora australis]|uniref:Frequency clock protein n=1 Tax=Podospora australis TaxID=1536484 RepID=A0AAN7ANU2_9PEZI|nr:putative frequency clock protein [Podospora australis]